MATYSVNVYDNETILQLQVYVASVKYIDKWRESVYI